MSADKAPAEKLPLAVRKNVRDSWDSKKADLEAKLLEQLGVAWTFDVNPLVIYPYAEEGSYGHHSLGDCIFAYFDGFMYGLNYFLQYHGDAGKDELNTVCSSHTVTLLPSTKFSYCGSEVADGQLRLLFHPNNLGSNINDAAQKLAETLSSAPQPNGAPSLSYTARHSIKTEYTSQVTDLLEKSRKILQNPKLEFQPDFDALGAKLKEGKDVRDDWETNLGGFALSYLESFVSVLEREKFADDEMLREGFEEGVEKGIVRVRIVDKLTNGGYNETLLEDGAVVIQTTPNNWGTNIHHAAEKLVDIL
ncbi:hypothetical protein BKA65DRAFT_597075 [Rhexocercosporidium sp. MPI-PUGE-AT-0058]|nr:hypothetical protein BKA65DRAFT_597075 [Rhexocercosporidium sp. MPI-PUGE-AT-0058]